MINSRPALFTRRPVRGNRGIPDIRRRAFAVHQQRKCGSKSRRAREAPPGCPGWSRDPEASQRPFPPDRLQSPHHAVRGAADRGRRPVRSRRRRNARTGK